MDNEIEGLNDRGISLKDRLFISENAHVVLDYHKAEDQLREDSLGKNKIGTTKRGIGPTYAGKVNRIEALRMTDLVNGGLIEKIKAMELPLFQPGLLTIS